MGSAGRPLKLDAIVGQTEDGQPITAGDRVLELTRTTWSPRRYIAAHAGLNHVTLNSWRREGGLARAAMARGEKVTQNQRRLAAFLTAWEKAEAEAVAARLGVIREAAAGGWVKTKTVTKVNADGEVVETTTTTETLAPEWQAAAWMLERRRPEDFGRRVEVTGKDGSPLIPKEDRAGQLAASLEGFLAGADAQRERDGEREAAGS